MKMPFGKHEGLDLVQLPTPYLMWFCSQYWAWSNYPQLAAALLDALRDRLVAGVPADLGGRGG